MHLIVVNFRTECCDPPHNQRSANVWTGITITVFKHWFLYDVANRRQRDISMQIQRSSAMRFGQLVLFLAALFLSVSAVADTGANLWVETWSGDVKLRVQNQWQTPSDGLIVQLPATVSTGNNGSLTLRQGETKISVASNTALEFFAGPDSDSVLHRVVQDKGSAFYDVAPRESNKLRVETPYLAAVIKGTEFDVTVAGETSTVSLFEGRLQIEADDINDVVQLFEGQIATRSRYDSRITVINMSDGEPVARTDARTSVSGNSDRDGNAGGASGSGGSVTPGSSLLDGGIDADLDLVAGLTNGSLNVSLNAGEISLSADLSVGDLSLGVGLDTGDLTIGTSLDAGDLSLDAGLDSGTLDVDLGAGDTGIDVDISDTVVDVDLDLDVDVVPDIEIEVPLVDVEGLIPDPGGLIGL